MKMKQLFNHTSTLLRTALLLGAMTFVSIQQTQAQTAEQLAAMPNAFETKVPSDVIGDGNYYYIQFYFSTNISYLSDQGNGNQLWSKDYIPFAKNLQWTLVSTGVNNQFKLKSLSGNWAYFDGTNYISTNDESQASVFTYYNHTGGGYEIGPVTDTSNTMAGNKKTSGVEYPWVNIWNNSKGNDRSRLRVAKLKDNVAHIIYWQETIYNSSNNPVDPNADSRANANGFTTHHYLTYSGTGDEISDAVSSRKSVVWYYDAWNTLPTLAAYHQDGLWTLEKVGDNGEFYIKKYGTEEYLNYQNGISELGSKNADYGRYALEFPNANRYTRIQNANKFEIQALTASMFFNWNGVGAYATHVNEDQPAIDFHVGSEVGNGGTIVGRGDVLYSIYADLTGSAKLVFEGTPGMQIRVLLNRQEPIAQGENGYDPNGGNYVERFCTLDGYGKAELDVSDLPYVHLNSIKNWSGSNGTVTAITFERTNYTESSLASSQFYTWNGVDAAATHASDTPAEGVQININIYRYPNQVIAGLGNASVYYTTYADLTGCTKMIIEGDPGMKLRVLLNRPEPVTGGDPNGGTAIERIVTINSYGKAEVDLSDLPYVHLNAIKVAGDSPNGTITSIKLLAPASGGNSLYLSCSKTDGVAVSQASGGNNDYKYTTDWVAGFMPVEVPVPNKDEFYQVLVKWGSNMIDHNGHSVGCPTNENDYDLWQLEMVDDYEHFRLKAPNGGYLKPGGSGVTPPNDPTDAEILPNKKFWTDFSLTWFYVNPVDKEIPVNYYVTHRESYLKQYSEAHSDLDLEAQGLATKAQSDWWNFDGNGFDTPQKGTQKVNHFEITHYVKQGNSVVVEFPTVLNKSNDHIYFQRFYNYDEKDTEMDLDKLKAHVSLDTRDDGNVQYFLYKNGIVTGQKIVDGDGNYKSGIDWTGIDDGGMARYALRRFNFTNSDAKRFTVGVDVSRYSDLTYLNSTSHLLGDLEEPSLTMRYIYYMRDAKEMAASLTACPEGGTEWLETKEFHFPARRIGYELEKKVGYQGEFIGLRHVFSDYWVFDDPSLVTEYNNAFDVNGNLTTDISNLNNHLVSAVDDNTKGKIEVEIVDNDHGGTGIRLGGWNPTIAAAHSGNLKFVDNSTDNWGDAEDDFRGFYFYDKMSDGNKTEYGNSRFVVFRYPEGGVVSNPTYTITSGGSVIEVSKKAYVNVYLNNNGTRYQLAQYTIIFDPLTQTLPWKLRDDRTNPVNPTVADPLLFVKDSYRDPKNLVGKAGKPIAKITFDYPASDTYHFPAKGQSKQGWSTPTGGTLADCSPIPLTFGNTNYSFMGFECNWGSYSIVNKMTTNYGNHQKAAPANDNTYGYGVSDITTNPQLKSLQPDAGLQNGFLYIDASEQPGDICSAPFIGDFCSGDKLMFSGWISGSNKMGGGDNRCPGGVTLTVKGEHNLHDSDGKIVYDENGKPKKEIVTLYRFCPGQCYELDDGPDNPDGSGGGDGTHNVIWQQFYFEFTVTDKYDRHWIEVNNNCVSSQGGDFMLDNIEVYAIVPEVIPGINTPLCVSGVDEHGNPLTDMRLLKLSLDFNKLKSSSGLNSGTAEEGFVFLDKYKFLTKFRSGLAALTPAQKTALHLDAFDFTTITLDALADAIEDGQLNSITGDNSAYQAAFDEAVLGEKTTWYSKNPSVNMNSSIMYFEWNSDFESMPEYSFASAVNKKSPVYREVVNGEKFVVMNGNFPELQWKTNTDYYVINSNVPITSHNTGQQFSIFNLCSECTTASVFRIEPPYHVLGLESSETTGDYVVCEGQIPTILLDLRGYTLDGKEVDMNDLNFDWWLGDKNATDPADRLATLENYHKQTNGAGVKLDEALSTLRTYYPAVTSLDGITKEIEHHPDPKLTVAMIEYLQSLIDKGELILHQKSVNIPAEKASNEDPYFYLVACPIHDEKFDQALNPAANQYVSYFCDEPQGLRIKVGQKAPRLKCGFVPNENGFTEYQYPTDSDPVLSIRLAKAAQFETVRNTENEATGGTLNTDVRYLWLPIRNAQTQTATGVVKKAQDDNIYLASTNDPEWDKKIYKAMSQTVPSLPVVGRIVKLTAINTGNDPTSVDQIDNRLCVYFTKNFEVREGYNYTLSLPFQEEGDVNTCDGTILINLKIVPDYEVWTGGADNSDWNNDDNWRRADGNTINSSGVNGDELYVEAAESGSPLENYTTNADNYRTPKDRIFRKGFAPLYCTHVLLKSDEWGKSPVLYDAIDGRSVLDKKPFPNLRDKDGWDGDPDTKATATAILRYDMQARLKDIWKETYGTESEKTDARNGDLLAEMYQLNSCDEIVFQPGAELRNASLLNYNSAWVEYQLKTNRWYLLGSPLQGTLSGEWYAPTGTAQQKTTYYDPVIFGPGYDRYSPAIYQRSWDKAKAVLYEVGATYDKDDDTQTNAYDVASQGSWANNNSWDATGADTYLDRLGYKPFGNKKANVAIKGIWSNTYNDAQVDYGNGGFSVMVMNHLKSNDTSGGKAIIRLPKEDYVYDYYRFTETGEDNGGTETDLDNVRKQKNRGLNRGRLKTDLLLPTSAQKVETEENPTSLSTKYADKYGYRTITRVPLKEEDLQLLMFGDLSEPVVEGASSLGYYLIENPFPCGLDMDLFFAVNYKLQKKYWLLTSGGQQLVQYATTGWVTPDPTLSDPMFSPADHVVAPGQGFFVQYNPDYIHDPSETVAPPTNIIFNKDMQAQSRFGKKTGQSTYTIEVGQKQKMEELKELVDDDNDPNTPAVEQIVYTNVDLNGNGIYGETGITLPGETETRDEKEPVMVPVYKDDPDNPGTKIPDLIPIMEDVVVYRYVQSTVEGETFPLKARTRGEEVEDAVLPGLVITAKRGESQSSALVMQHDKASNDFLPSEDTETFITSDLENVPTVYTLCGRLATTINSIHDFRSLPIGVESSSDAPCTLTFKGVELLGDSISFYDAVEQKLMPLESGTKVVVSGQTQNRYYIVRSLNQKEAAEETHLQIFTEGLTAKVIASTAEPITSVRCYDTAGRLIHSATPQTSEYSFTLPTAGIYIINAETENDRKTKKVMTK